MHKRIIAMALCLCLLVTALPVQAFAEPEAESIKQQMVDDYNNILRYTNMSSLAGWCGLMASWQLYVLGINSWVVSYHGKDQYDAYKNVAVTSGGHRVRAYDAADYTLEEALLALCKNGTVNVYNILVGYQRTNTQLGSIYGHSMVIYAILDGIVYFTEGYYTPFGPPGVPMEATIEEFSDYYCGRGVFEGLIHFGRKGYVGNCSEFATNTFVEVQTAAPMYSQPCAPGTEDSQCEFVRTVNIGERLWANAVYENPQGEFYYQISEGEEAGYIPAELVTPFLFVYSDIGISNVQNPTDMQVGKTCDIKGRVASEYSTMGAVRMVVTDMAGNVVLNHALAKLSGVYDLESDTFSWAVEFNYLEEGAYLYNIYADGLNFYVEDGQIVSDSRQLLLVQSMFRVGQAEGTAPELPAEEPQRTDGWLWQDGTWYCYDGDTPRTGWYCYHGGDYYLRPDGSVTTGWAEINGKLRYFSSTGCMRTDWLETENGTMYLMFNGVPVTGTRTIEGTEYTFDENGYLIRPPLGGAP